MLCPAAGEYLAGCISRQKDAIRQVSRASVCRGAMLGVQVHTRNARPTVEIFTGNLLVLAWLRPVLGRVIVQVSRWRGLVAQE